MLTGLYSRTGTFYRYRYVIYTAILLTLIAFALIVPGTSVLAGGGHGGSVCNGC